MAKILLIDDDLNLLQMVRLMLSRVGHEVETVDDGEKGVALARQVQPDVAIIDVMMPDISGYDVVRRLRADPATARIPVIILTARNQPMDRHMAIEVGANSFLAKPVTSKELIARVEAVLKAGAGFRVTTDMLTEPLLPPGSRPAPPTTDSLGPREPVITPPPPLPRTGKRMPIGAEDAAAQTGEYPVVTLPAVTVISLRGGTGTTTVAVNLAVMLAMFNERVALTDLSPAGGHVHLHMHLTAQKNWGQLLPLGDYPDSRALDELLTYHDASGIAVLAAPALPSGQTLSKAAAQNVLRELHGGFSRLIVDARSLDSGVIGALTISSAVIVVLADDPPSIQSTGQLLLALKGLGIDLGRVRLVLNHIRATTDVPVETIQKAIKRPLNAELPYDPNHLTAIRRGVPLAMANPDGPFCRALAQVARTLVF